jgi:hypothetical protein
MTTTRDPVIEGLREHLAARDDIAGQAMSSAAVIERLATRLAPRHTHRRVTALAGGLVAALLLALAITLPLVLERSRGAAPAAPPSGVPVIWHYDANDTTLLDAYDWSGRKVGSLRIPAPLVKPGAVYPAQYEQNSDGSRLVLTEAFNPRRWVVDGSGQRLYDLPPAVGTLANGEPDYTRVTFAADNRTLCEQRGPGGEGQLATGRWQLYAIDGSGKERFVWAPAPADAVDKFWHVVSCGAVPDVAVMDDYYEAIGVNLSTGAELWRRTGRFVASADGRVLLEGIIDRTSSSITIRDVRTGAALGQVTLPATATAITHSSLTVWMTPDTRYLLLRWWTPADQAQQSGLKAELLDWRSGHVQWSRTLDDQLDPWLVQPGGESVAAPFHSQNTGGCELLIFSADGRQRVLSREGHAGC